MNVASLLRVGRNVTQLDNAADFYADVLGFQPAGAAVDDPGLAALLGVERVRRLRLRRGGREIELSQCIPPGAAYPGALRANDPAFQHIALVTNDIAAAAAAVLRQGAVAISRNGPVRLALSSGSVYAFKFRDPDGHPLEFLQFPEAVRHQPAGFDHSAISVSDVEESMAFYKQLGLSLASRQINHGPTQDALDGLPDVTVDVVALRPFRPAPHVELLGYRGPPAGPTVPYRPSDVCADRLVFSAADRGLNLMRDPDGHVILIDGR